MKTLSKILLALTAVAALSFAYPAKANLVTNPGFETGDFTGWTTSGTPFVTGPIFGISPHSGNFQAVILNSSIGQTLTTTPGQSYTITFWMATGSGLSDVQVIWGGSPVFSAILDNGPTGYSEFTVNVTASSASTSIIFGAIVGVPLLDDISVNPTVVGVPDTGSTVSLLGCASLGLAALRRKLGC